MTSPVAFDHRFRRCGNRVPTIEVGVIEVDVHEAESTLSRLLRAFGA